MRFFRRRHLGRALTTLVSESGHPLPLPAAVETYSLSLPGELPWELSRWGPVVAPVAEVDSDENGNRPIIQDVLEAMGEGERGQLRAATYLVTEFGRSALGAAIADSSYREFEAVGELVARVSPRRALMLFMSPADAWSVLRQAGLVVPPLGRIDEREIWLLLFWLLDLRWETPLQGIYSLARGGRAALSSGRGLDMATFWRDLENAVRQLIYGIAAALTEHESIAQVRGGTARDVLAKAFAATPTRAPDAMTMGQLATFGLRAVRGQTAEKGGVGAELRELGIDPELFLRVMETVSNALVPIRNRWTHRESRQGDAARAVEALVHVLTDHMGEWLPGLPVVVSICSAETDASNWTTTTLVDELDREFTLALSSFWHEPSKAYLMLRSDDFFAVPQLVDTAGGHLA